MIAFDKTAKICSVTRDSAPLATVQHPCCPCLHSGLHILNQISQSRWMPRPTDPVLSNLPIITAIRGFPGCPQFLIFLLLFLLRQDISVAYTDGHSTRSFNRSLIFTTQQIFFCKLFKLHLSIFMAGESMTQDPPTKWFNTQPPKKKKLHFLFLFLKI